MKTQNVALIGCEATALDSFIPYINACSNLELTDVADDSEILGAYAANEVTGTSPNIFQDYKKLLESTKANTVFVFSKTQDHYQHAKAALESGKDVYIYGALSSTYEQAQELQEIATENDCVLGGGHNQILLPGFEQAMVMTQAEELGTLLGANANYICWGQEYNPTREQFPTNDLSPAWCYAAGAGPLRQGGLHGINVLTEIMGAVTEVSAMASLRQAERTYRFNNKKESEVFTVTEPDEYTVNLRFHNGSMGTLRISNAPTPTHNPWGNTEILGDKASLDIIRKKGLGDLELTFRQPGQKIEPEIYPTILPDHLQDLGNRPLLVNLDHFIERTQTGREVYNIHNAVHSLAIVEAAEQSVNEGRVIQVKDAEQYQEAWQFQVDNLLQSIFGSDGRGGR